jgi:maltose alpha-D-glucosyltransferase/alpha-amylase
MLRTDSGVGEGQGTETSLPVLRVADGWNTLLTGAAQRRLETDVLPSYLPHQRWFGGKARTMQRVRVIDHAVLHEANPPLLHAMIEVAYTEGSPETYTLMLSVSDAERTEALAHQDSVGVLARMSSPCGEGVLHDALADKHACATLLTFIQNQRQIATASVAIRTFVTAADAPMRDLDPEALTIRRLPIEQSNTSIVYDSRVILKCFRRVESRVNPDVEISRHLTDVVPFAHILPLIIPSTSWNGTMRKLWDGSTRWEQ